MGHAVVDRVSIKNRLTEAGLRPTRQRLAVAELLLQGEHRHVSAEGLLAEARQAGAAVSQATVYNILRQFADAGLIRELSIGAGRSWFDTRTSAHVHVLDESTGAIRDLDFDPHALGLLEALNLPPDVRVSDISILLRVKQK